MASAPVVENEIVDLVELASILSSNSQNSSTEDRLELLDTRRTHAQILYAWETTPLEFRGTVKTQVLSALGSRRRRARILAARVVSKIASLEIPRSNWPRLIKRLLTGARRTPKDDLCEGTVMCLKYMCDESPHIMTLHATDILQVLCNAFSRRNDNLQLAVVSCIESLVPLMPRDESQEKKILYMLCSAIVEENPSQVRGMAFMGLKNAAQFVGMAEYFELIRRASFQTIEACLEGKEDDDVGIEVIEFWSTRAEFEAHYVAEDKMKMSLKGLDGLLLLYFECLKRQAGGATMSDDIKNRDWTIALAAGASLDTLAKIYGEKVFPKVFKFIDRNLDRAYVNDEMRWRSREAAVCALGSCINRQTCSQEILLTHLDTFLMDMFPRFMEDPHEMVRQTTMWTFGKICKFAPRVVPLSNGKCLEIVQQSLSDGSDIASYACWCICSLSIHLAHADRSNAIVQNPLESAAPDVLQKLVAQAIRLNTTAKLAQSCCEAVNHVIENTNLSTEFLTRLVAQFIIQIQHISSEHRTLSYLNLKLYPGLKMSLLASFYPSLWHTLNRLNESHTGYMFTETDARTLLDSSYTLVSQRFTDERTAPSDELYEDVLLTWSAVAENLETDFAPFFGSVKLQRIVLYPFKIQHGRLSDICCGVIGDIYRALEGHSNMTIFSKFTDSVVDSLLQNVNNANVPIQSKGHAVGALADIAICCQPQWAKYLGDALTVCVPLGCILPKTSNSPELISVFGDFRSSIIDLCRSSLVGGLSQNSLDILVHHIGTFLHVTLSNDGNSYITEECVEGMISLAGDMLEGAFVRFPYPDPFQSVFDRLLNLANVSTNSSILLKIQSFQLIKERVESTI